MSLEDKNPLYCMGKKHNDKKNQQIKAAAHFLTIFAWKTPLERLCALHYIVQHYTK